MFSSGHVRHDIIVFRKSRVHCPHESTNVPLRDFCTAVSVAVPTRPLTGSIILAALVPISSSDVLVLIMCEQLNHINPCICLLFHETLLLFPCNLIEMSPWKPFFKMCVFGLQLRVPSGERLKGNSHH